MDAKLNSTTQSSPVTYKLANVLILIYKFVNQTAMCVSKVLGNRKNCGNIKKKKLEAKNCICRNKR
jgi:hypothetical protein